jgi:hypothetical protein
VTPVRIGVVTAALLGIFAALAGYETVVLADGGEEAVAGACAVALGLLLTHPRARRSFLLPVAAAGVGALAVHASSTGVPSAIFGALGGYLLGTFVRVTSRVARLARGPR